MLNSEIIRGYCHTCCHTHVQTVLDKDSFALEQYNRSKNSENSKLHVCPVSSKSESQSAKSEPVVAKQPVNVVTNNITTLNNQKQISGNEQLKYNAVTSYNDKSERRHSGTEKVGNFIVGTAIICYAIMIILAIVLSIVSIIIHHFEGVILGLLIAFIVYLKMDSDRR